MNVYLQSSFGIALPFLGTSVGAAAVFFRKKECRQAANELLLGFASGVMIAASVWSLLLPALETSQGLGHLAFLPATVGFFVGGLLPLLLEKLIGRFAAKRENLRPGGRRILLLILTVTLHNLPEGMAVGVVYAGLLSGSAGIGFSGALALSLGIALQNLPEGAIVSLPAHAAGASKGRAFVWGVLSGAVEPIGALFTLLLTSFAAKALPFTLAFAAGAMICVSAKELIPQAQEKTDGRRATVSLLVGFALMMALDTAMG